MSCQKFKQSIGYIDPFDYNNVIKKLRSFFNDHKEFIEVHGQSRFSIMAACEDPKTISTMEYAGSVWPLPQTTQIHLEQELLTHPEIEGNYSVCTSYRNEPNPVEGRHNLCFPLFDFELKGDMRALIEFEKELLEHLGYGSKENFPEIKYDDACDKYDVSELEHIHEKYLSRDYGPVVFLTDFPVHTSPFWNMKLHPGGRHAYKVDVILSGQETIGSAQRSSSASEMREMFHTISDGDYANILYKNFSKERVENELEDFLSQKFITRSGGGIGLTRLIRSMKIENLL